jgi:hypothetical protein
MSWVQKHWGKEYTDMAKSNIQGLVHLVLVFIFLDGVSSSTLKMQEYREKSATSDDEEEVEQVHRANAMDHSHGDVPTYMLLAEQYRLEDDMDIKEIGGNVQSVELEYQSYIMGALSAKSVDILKFWEVNCAYYDFLIYTDWAPQSNRTTYPTIFAIAMDYLPIQASSVPCERVFSSSAETDTRRRNCISPLMMEVLQMLKFQLRKECLDFTAGWGTSERQMVDDDLEEDLLQKLLQLNFDDHLDTLMQTIDEHED